MPGAYNETLSPSNKPANKKRGEQRNLRLAHHPSVISQQLSIINHRSQLIARLEAIASSSPRITQLPPNYRPTTTDPLAHPEEARVARLIIVCD